MLPGLGADAVVVTPAHQFPLGVTMAPSRRSELLAWARDAGAFVIEDDYDGELRYDRQPVGSLQSLDAGRVIYAGTTSKSLAAALRIGWLAVPPQLMDSLVDAGRQISAWPSSLDQIALARIIEAANPGKGPDRASFSSCHCLEPARCHVGPAAAQPPAR